tara:strand:- start:225 stop:1400 length:1176 start_codon:yes stop_codon:yes gene_type:complete
MRKQIAILGSTGSIGKQTLEIVKKDLKKFNIILLSTNSNVKEISHQIKIFKPKNLVVTNREKFFHLKKKYKKINIYNNYECFKKIFPRKIDYVMSSISGFEGLQPTIDIIKYTKLIAIANKESIICGWDFIKKKLNKNKTRFVPVDSEHFSIWTLISDKSKNIEKIFITASGGPFLNEKRKNLKFIKPSAALKHPKWKMGKKISIDSATMVNKVFEIIEAKKIFNLSVNKINILSHPESYVHAIVQFKNGLTKILTHDTDMKIPIFNSLYKYSDNMSYPIKIDIKKLNNLNLKHVNKSQFPILKIIKYFPFKKDVLLDTVLVSANDELVDLFLKNKISFLDISKKLESVLKLKEFKKLRYKKPNNLTQIINLNKYVRLKTRALCVVSNDDA